MASFGIKKVKNTDIASSYDIVSKGYDTYFLKTMHRHNDEVLSLLLKKSVGEQVLDLACGTGYNTRFLQKHGVKAEITLVDLSEGMLTQAKEKSVNNNQQLTFIHQDMLSYLRSCPDEKYDTVICMWAIKYQPPMQVIKECARILKKGGRMAVIVNTADTLLEIRALYPKLLVRNVLSIQRIMRDLPNPKNSKVFEGWFTDCGFDVTLVQKGSQRFGFANAAELVEFVTATGALAGYDRMIDLRSDKIKQQMIQYFDTKQIDSTEHRFVYGIFEKRKNV
ncbi:class I SAM-dependent methyltransferase [Clostridium aminobutyricum]|uniref:Methyltransferase domain-containing protein n=1 Tax=Clostridium aminobutyricum TaxID=33953 RepID=A0A939D753_CLOAM|nr:class I SAM-dependent methyltransferase [Clostridium aminobutyricum]MBN7772310.1 methyltransferase domain-containing protein [Clostridium aminobutyricum]